MFIIHIIIVSDPEGPHAQFVILTEGKDEGVFFQFSDSQTEGQVSWTMLSPDGCGHPAGQPLHHGAPLQLQHRHAAWEHEAHVMCLTAVTVHVSDSSGFCVRFPRKQFNRHIVNNTCIQLEKTLNTPT